MPTQSEAHTFVAGLLQPDRRPELEKFRFPGSTNRVYWVPLGDDPNDFVIVKLLPGWRTELKMALKRPIRNLLYGEHDVRVGRARVGWEIQRYREWTAAGIPVPPLVESPLPGVRIFKGIPLPTFYTVLTEPVFSIRQKLTGLHWVVRGLAHQHRVAASFQRKSLVHREPGPWNVLVDLEQGAVYWYDLEHPADYPGMTLESLMVRGLRIFVFGVLGYLPRPEDVLEIIVQEYEPADRLEALASGLEQSAQARPQRIARRLGIRKKQFANQARVAAMLHDLVRKRV